MEGVMYVFMRVCREKSKITLGQHFNFVWMGVELQEQLWLLLDIRNN